jgi:hypothetical protein
MRHLGRTVLTAYSSPWARGPEAPASVQYAGDVCGAGWRGRVIYLAKKHHAQGRRWTSVANTKYLSTERIKSCRGTEVFASPVSHVCIQGLFG